MVSLALGISACGGDGDTDDGVEPPSFVLDVEAAIEAVETELGGPQEFFEVTANPQFTNIFVAVDDGTAAVGYLYADGELQPPSPKQTGATGRTFTAADVDFEPGQVLTGVTTDLPNATVDAISVYGDGIAAVYVLGVTSERGGALDIEVGPNGDVRSVDPV